MSAADELKLLIAECDSPKADYDRWMALGAHLATHAADFVALIEAAEGLFAGEGQITIGEFESLKNALKPFTKE